MKIAWERRGAGPSLLLIQGLGYGRWGWAPIVPALARSFDVLTFDNRGIGGSDAPLGPYTATQMAADAAQVLDEAGLERAHVVGTSLGGMVAQELAHARPERVDRLVLACTTPGGPEAHPMPEQTIELLQAAAILPEDEALRRFVVNALDPDPRPELVERILEHRLANRQDPLAWAAQAAAAMGFDRYEDASSLALPTLVQHGDGDVVVDPRNSELLADLIPDARFEVYAGCGHLFFWQAPERFVRELEAFLL
ncbi:MAG: alpha/beta fold hydrolase [Gaiellaceae bacterium]